MIFIVILLIAIGIFSTSFGNEEQEQTQEAVYPYNIGTVTAETLKIRSGLSLENNYIGLLKKGENVHIYRKSG